MVDVGYTIVLLGIILAMYYGSYRMIKNFVNATKKGLSKTITTIFGIAIAGGVIYLAASELRKKVELFIQLRWRELNDHSTMTNEIMTDAVQLAKHYFDLSNEGKLTEIKELFTSSSTYSSANMDVYLGADQIMNMQTKFFAGFDTMGWYVNSVKEVKPGIVLFDFTFTGKTLDGESIQRSGREYVVVYNGKIQHIEVRNKD